MSGNQLEQKDKTIKTLESNNKQQLKHFHTQLQARLHCPAYNYYVTITLTTEQEADRKSRQRDLEIEKLHRHIEKVSSRDSSSSPNKYSSTPVKSPLTGGTGNSSLSKNTPKTNKLNGVFSTPRSARAGHGNESDASPESDITCIVETLEADKSQLLRQNEVLQQQISSLLHDLNSKGFNGLLSESLVDGVASESSTGCNTGIVKEMLTKMKEQQQRIAILTSIRDNQSMQLIEAEKLIGCIKVDFRRARDDNENLQAELASRPTVKQLNGLVRDLNDSEERLHVAAAGRREREEYCKARRFLSTSEQIKADRRNRELELGVVDALPKAIMRETLQAVCRALDLTDIVEILPSVEKLKAVVLAVPRIERFVSQICAFVATADRVAHTWNSISRLPDSFVMEDVLPILQRFVISVLILFIVNLMNFVNIFYVLKLLTGLKFTLSLLGYIQNLCYLIIVFKGIRLIFCSVDRWKQEMDAIPQLRELQTNIIK